MGFITMSDLRANGKPPIHNSLKAITMSNMGKRKFNQYWDSLFDSKGQLRNNKKLSEQIPSGLWKGIRCFIVGGGASLEGFDFDLLKGEAVITVNRAFEFFSQSAINIFQDARVFGYYENNQFAEGGDAKLKFERYKGFKTWLNVQAFPFPEDIYCIRPCHITDFNWQNYSNGIPPYGNSGLNALTLAVCLGANPIYLLGFDCKKSGNKPNFHSGYPSGTSDEAYKRFISDFKESSHFIKQKTKVINLNRQSALQCFEFGDIEGVPKITKPVYISFYTVNTGYQWEKERLVKSARRFGIMIDFYEQKDLGSWRANIHDRIRILRYFLDKYKGQDIVYIDCDAEIANYPFLFDNWDKGDFGIHKIDREQYFGEDWNKHWKEQYEYLGGTMYLSNNDKIRQLLNIWEEMDKPMDTPLSQFTLIEAIRKMQKKGLVVYEIPANYCQIFDIMRDVGEPVIEHFQASRRGIVNVKINGNKRSLVFGEDRVYAEH